ncbi:hypothetical protein AVEN_269923-1 [Araneus ventricosus]|uniref:Uncharacterized protein n=1 Tax=Araneus ventricosus TaxID=182803 RepID=A0A4Y2FRH9_ARAVE|nr:hypothetical protein AVEN_269923-1 [Araneus ventricosus]
MDLVILNHGQIEKAAPEPAFSSLNFCTTLERGSLTLDATAALIWSESVGECDIEESETVVACGAYSQRDSVFGQDQGIIDELVEEHNQELTTKERKELHYVSQQEVMEEGKGIHEKTPCDVTACRREYLRTALRSEERLYRLGSPWSTNAFGVLPVVRAGELSAIEGAVMVY